MPAEFTTDAYTRALYHLNESSWGTDGVLDSSGNGLHLSCTTTPGTGLMGNGFVAPGDNQIFKSVASGMPQYSATIEGWVCLPAGNLKGCFFYCGSDGGGYGIGTGGTAFENAGRKLVVLYGGAAWHVPTYTFPDSGSSTWFHVALVVESDGRPSMYVNGTKVTYAGTTAPKVPASGLCIGNEFSNTSTRVCVVGIIVDEVRYSSTIRYTQNFDPSASTGHPALRRYGGSPDTNHIQHRQPSIVWG